MTCPAREVVRVSKSVNSDCEELYVSGDNGDVCLGAWLVGGALEIVYPAKFTMVEQK